MKIKNTSKLFTNEQVREIINFVKPSGIVNFDVMVKNSKGTYAGYAYYRGSGYHATANPFVVIRLGSNHYPLNMKHEGKKGGYLSYNIYNNIELLVVLLAHELRHLWQAKIKRGWRVWGARGQFSERDADAYAIHKVREWRKKPMMEVKFNPVKTTFKLTEEDKEYFRQLHNANNQVISKAEGK